ncbi:MAG: hypothetical protein ACLR8L_00375 [Oscillospiraceae bacterium]
MAAAYTPTTASSNVSPATLMEDEDTAMPFMAQDRDVGRAAADVDDHSAAGGPLMSSFAPSAAANGSSIR